MMVIKIIIITKSKLSIRSGDDDDDNDKKKKNNNNKVKL
jgi:hypothetical protein